MFKVYYRIIISAKKTFGVGSIFLRWLIIPPIFIIFTHLTLFLDRIFFPQYQKLQVKNPVFIIGHPRSGNSFLHHLLTQTEEFVGFKTWQIIFPSLTARVLFKPLVNYLINQKRSSLIPDKIGHEVSLEKVEEEELLFFHKLDTQFVWARSPLGFDDQEHPEFRFHDQQSKSRRYGSVNFLKGCLQRQMFYTGKTQLVLQTLQSVHRIKTLLSVFPDAKFIYLMRSPYETIPSHLSVLWFLLDHQIGVNNVPPDKLKLYFERRYRYNIDIYRYFYELEKNQEIPQDSFMVLPYEQLRFDLDKAIKKIVEFTGIELSTALKKTIEEQAAIQQQYKRKHQILKLEKFNLTKEQIAQDFSFVFEEYDFLEKSSTAKTSLYQEDN
jgi:hypothetical protein